VGSWLVLNLIVNADYPASWVRATWFAPSWETSAIVLFLALWVTVRRPVPNLVHAGFATLLLCWAAFHGVDSFYRRFFNREFRAVIDAPPLPEAWTLLVTTDGFVSALVEMTLGALALVALAWLLYRTSKLNASALEQLIVWRAGTREPRPRRHAWLRSIVLVTVVMAGPGVLSLLSQDSTRPLGPMARAASEFTFFLDYPEIRAAARERFARLSERAVAPPALDALAGRDVSLILIESYGRGAVESQSHSAEVRTALQRLEDRLTERGRVTASAWMGPPTYGGGSWYAHATLTTGVKVWTPLDYSLLLDSDVVPLSRRMKSYGYHTVNVMPGTTRVWPEGSYFGFDELMYAWHFDYVGPTVGWGRFPDQLVLDQVRRKAAKTERPTYKEIKLVTSHAPWRAVPPVLEDWESIGDGALYNTLSVQHFDLKWSALEHAHGPYMATILYALDVVGDYVRRFEQEDAQAFVLGDHQPLSEASLSELWDVPVHIAGPAELVERFVEQGFTPGMYPSGERPALAMEEFLPLFLRSLSHGQTAAAPPLERPLVE